MEKRRPKRGAHVGASSVERRTCVHARVSVAPRVLSKGAGEGRTQAQYTVAGAWLLPGATKNGAGRKGARRGYSGCRGTISRVMSWVIICLGLPLPAGSSNQPVTGRAALCHVSVLLRMGFTCARPVTAPAVVSYTALPPLPGRSLAVYFCCTVPGVASAGR